MEFRITYGVWCSLFTDKIRTLKIEKTNTQKTFILLYWFGVKNKKANKKTRSLGQIKKSRPLSYPNILQ